MGMINDRCTPKLSAIAPIARGKMAPPRIIITNNDEPWLVYLPNPEIANVNIFDHIIELNNPIPIIVHKARLPVELRAITKKIIFIAANTYKVLFGIDFPIKNPMRLITRKIKYINAASKLVVSPRTTNPNIEIEGIKIDLTQVLELLNETAPMNLPIICPPQ